MEKNKCRLITEEEKSILRGVKTVREGLEDRLEDYIHLMIDIDNTT